MEESLSAQQRLLAASAGAMLTALVVTPFDVVKTRMQAGVKPEPCRQVAQEHGVGELAACPRCGVWVLNNGLMEHTLSKHECQAWFEPPAANVGSAAAAPARGESAAATAAMLSRVARTEGLGGLYAGIGPTLAMAVPNTALYFTAYDELRKQALFPEPVAPALSGASARVVAATCVAPFELARTQLQALPPEKRGLRYLRDLASTIRDEGVLRSVFRGLAPTLWRDVPFSALYWAAYDKARTEFLRSRRPLSPVAASFCSGLVAGAAAALLTTPFDVIKTRRMVEAHTGHPVARTGGSVARLNSFGLLHAIATTEGLPALFTGAVPRLLKVAPACAIMIGTYEYAKTLFLQASTGVPVVAGGDSAPRR